MNIRKEIHSVVSVKKNYWVDPEKNSKEGMVGGLGDSRCPWPIFDKFTM